MRLVEMFEKQVEEEREKYSVYARSVLSFRNEQRRMHTKLWEMNKFSFVRKTSNKT